MKKIPLSAIAVIITLFSVHAQAQSQAPSLINTDWKLFLPELSDSLTLHIKSDSSYVTTTSGDVVVRSICKISGDTLALTDYDGQYACPNATGRYTVNLNKDANAMTLTLIDDPCDSRANNINRMTWTRSAVAPATMK